MRIFGIAIKNILGAGLRTWLNVIVLSFSFVLIITMKGWLEGWNRQASSDSIAWEYGGGHLLQKDYDPLDPFTFTKAHEKLQPSLQKAVEAGEMTPILLTSGSIYPDGRMQNAILRGIDPEQDILEIPGPGIRGDEGIIPVVLGNRMARDCDVEVGDEFMIQWRDANGTFDASEARVVEIFQNTVPTTDAGQVWIALESLRDMLGTPGEATYMVMRPGLETIPEHGEWILRSQDDLLEDIRKVIASKSVGMSIFYTLLLGIALLAVFDTQVLSIFRRQREIGTYIALGMTRGQVIRLFTFEGAMHSVLAALLAAVYGIPLLVWLVNNGITMPVSTDDYGMSIAETMYPTVGVQLVISTILIVMIATTIVSYLPSRKIAKMNPTEAIKGKIQ